MSSDTVVIGSVGILTSGVLGPAVAARWARRRQQREFEHDLALRRCEDLRQVLDDAAVLLGAGVTNLRRIFDAERNRSDIPTDIKEWASRVHLARERILLRLDEDDPVVAHYNEARDALAGPLHAAFQADASRIGGAETQSDASLGRAIEDFETKRSAFLHAARVLLGDSDIERRRTL